MAKRLALLRRFSEVLASMSACTAKADTTAGTRFRAASITASHPSSHVKALTLTPKRLNFRGHSMVVSTNVDISCSRSSRGYGSSADLVTMMGSVDVCIGWTGNQTWERSFRRSSARRAQRLVHSQSLLGDAGPGVPLLHFV